MGLYDGIKDVAKVLQKADNVDLYKQLLDLGAQALELQNEAGKLQTENTSLKKELEIKDDIVRYEEYLFVTRESDEAKIKYCSRCWDAERKLIQVDCYYDAGRFKCPHCETAAVYDQQKYRTNGGLRVSFIGL